jgi:transcriptional regulator with XRE-family HTH domain
VTFGEKLRQLRDAVGLSEVNLAAASGLPFGTVHEYVLGRRTPSFPNVLKLARALGTNCTAFADCDDMVGDEPAKPRSPAKGRGRPANDEHARATKKPSPKK